MYYCYETKKEFETLREIARYLDKSSFTAIRECLDKSNKTAYGFHWCTDLAKFDGIELQEGKGVYIYCYETKQRYKSYRNAAKSIKLGNRAYIIEVTNDPNRTAGGFHWCTSLDIFDGVKLTAGGLSFNKSSPEYEILDSLKEMGLEPLHGSRKIIPPYELDIFIPELNFAIEYNGKFWHDEELMQKYHYKSPVPRELKTQLCFEKGIELLHIEELDYKKNKTQILNNLRKKLS